LPKIDLIAEIGINHNGELDLALELISAAKEAGASSVKFQKRNPDVCVPETMKNSPRETPWGSMTYLDYKKRLEFGLEEYRAINRKAKEEGISWSASAWDEESLEFLDMFDLPYHKIASAMTLHPTLVDSIAKRQRPTLMSTGMISEEQLDDVVTKFVAINPDLTLLHCVSTYPASESSLNLRRIGYLAERYGLPVGYSGHEASVSPSVIAAAMGATVVERHFTLDRTMWGTDHAASLEPRGFRELAQVLGKIPLVSGVENPPQNPEELAVATRLRYWI